MHLSRRLTDDEAVEVLSGTEIDADRRWTDAKTPQSSVETWKVRFDVPAV